MEDRQILLLYTRRWILSPNVIIRRKLNRLGNLFSYLVLVIICNEVIKTIIAILMMREKRFLQNQQHS